MIGAMATMVAYTKRPKATFFVKHPVKAVRIMKFRNDVKDAFTGRHIALGLGAAAVAVPFGMWLGRRMGAM